MAEKRKLPNSAKDFIADRLQDFAKCLRDGEDPQFTFKVAGVTMQIRLMELPGKFLREEVEIADGD